MLFNTKTITESWRCTVFSPYQDEIQKKNLKKKKKDSNNTVKVKMLLFAREMQHSGRLPFYLIQKMETVTQTTCNLFQTSEVLKAGTSAAFGKFL